MSDNDKLYFYSKSKNALPGGGCNEYVSDINLYETLAQYPGFRKVLSNFHVAPFKYNGYTYNSIEHVFQAMKIALVDKEKAYFFTVESGHEIGLGAGSIAQKNRKLVMLSKDDLKSWSSIKNDIMKAAASEKYKTHPEALKILRATNDAELWHIVTRSKPERFLHLEDIRRELN